MNRVVIDGHNDVLTHLHDGGAPDDALLTDGAATITVPSARAGGLAAGLFAVLPPTGEIRSSARPAATRCRTRRPSSGRRRRAPSGRSPRG